MTETLAGKLDGDSPKQCVIREAIEEAGIHIRNPGCVLHCFMSPDAVKERLSLFVADYDSAASHMKGGGSAHESEDIETLELPLKAALEMVA